MKPPIIASVTTLSTPRSAPLLLLAATLAVALFGAMGAARAATVTIAPGDTLGAIAARHGLSVSALARANGIADPDHVVAGRRLSIPGGSAVAGPGGSGGYRVRSGDSLGSIASRHGTSVAAIVAANHIRDPNVIAAGMRLIIPSGAAGSVAVSRPSEASGGTYTVRPGDSLGAIAARHGVGTDALAALNGIRDPSRILAGRSLRIPGSAARSAAPGAASSPSEIASLIDTHSARYGVDPQLARAIAWQESGWRQSAVSGVGALGVMQLMPDTARWLGEAVVGRRLDPQRIEDNIEGGVAYLGWLSRHGGSTRMAVGGYYQGLASLRQRGPFDDTKSYVANVLSLVGRV